MKVDKILDKNIDSTNYAGFKKCSILDSGDRIKFVYACGAYYDVPIEYILMWFANPHYIVKNGRVNEWDETKYTFDQKNIKALKCHKVKDSFALRIYLSNSTAFDIAWDTVLMACEPSYEHYGGLTVEFKNIVKGWRKNRENRIMKA